MKLSFSTSNGFRTGLALGWAVVLLGCESSEPQGEAPPVPFADEAVEDVTANSVETISNASRHEIQGVSFRIPPHWKKVELTPAQAGFIDARYLIPVEGEELQLTVTSARGGIDANFERWEGQFIPGSGPAPHREKITVDGVDADWIDIRGTFTAGTGISAAEPQPGARLLGVGIPVGDSEMYLKLTGAEEKVAKLVEELRETVKSALLP